MAAFVSKLTPEQWADVRRLRTKGASFRDLAERFGIGAAVISSRARKEGWPAPSGTDGHAAAARPPIARKPPEPSPATANVRRRLAHRLYQVLELRISTMETSMKHRLQAQKADPAKSEPTPTKEERDAFAALIEQINQVTEMASEPAAADAGRRTKAAISPELTALSDDIEPAALAAASEKDAFRREIADQLEKFLPPA